MQKGYLQLVLHAHLPYIRHPEHEYSLEEQWLYEAVVETYLPLLEMFGRLINEGVPFRVTLSLSPTLLEMLSDNHHKKRIVRYIDRLSALIRWEISTTAKDTARSSLACMYLARAERCRELFAKKYQKDLVAAFRAVGESGQVEIITTSATHAYLPNFTPFPETVRRQIEIAIKSHSYHFGEAPRGLWLPECGYFEGLDSTLHKEGINFFFLETHGVLHARPRPYSGIYRPLRTPSGPVAFGRDSETSRLLWCARTGYPSHPSYRDFHRDLCWDLPLSKVKRYVHPGGIRVPTGIKYHRITGASENKELYIRKTALETAERHAHEFVTHMDKTADSISGRYGISPLITAAFDAELFGHWWFEGIEWLEVTLRLLGEKTVTPSEYLSRSPGLQVASPGLSSWGSGGYSRTWLDSSNRWAHEHLQRASEGMEILHGIKARAPLQRRAIRQAEREFLLAQSSDWTFLIHSGPSSGYAAARIMDHENAFSTLFGMIMRNDIDVSFLDERERKAPVFGWLRP